MKYGDPVTHIRFCLGKFGTRDSTPVTANLASWWSQEVVTLFQNYPTSELEELLDSVRKQVLDSVHSASVDEIVISLYCSFRTHFLVEFMTYQFDIPDTE